MRLLGMMCACAASIGVAQAQELVAVAPDGGLVSARSNRLWISGTSGDGSPLATMPEFVVPGATVVPLDDRVPPGVWSFAVVPPDNASSLGVELSVDGARRRVRLPVASPSLSALTLDGVPVYAVGRQTLRLEVPTDGTVPPEVLQVATSEGRVTKVLPVSKGLEVHLSIGDNPTPRTLVVAMRDLRGQDVPALSRVRLRKQLSLPFSNVAPGTTIQVAVGGRWSSPEVVGDTGALNVKVWQYPEHRDAVVKLVDRAGNETTRRIPLEVQSAGRLLSMVSRPRLPGRVAPVVWVMPLNSLGRTARAHTPRCATGGFGELPVVARVGGVFEVSTHPLGSSSSWDVSLVCEAKDVSKRITVPLAESVPVRLGMRMYPETISADFPVADVQAWLENALGERIDSGRIDMAASAGRIEELEERGPISAGVLRADGIVDIGSQTLTARWSSPVVSTGAPIGLELAVGTVPSRVMQPMVVYVRGFDLLHRSIVGVPVTLQVGARTLEGVTDARGWAAFEVPLDRVDRPVVVEARSPSLVHRSIVLPGTRGRRGPGLPDLSSTIRTRVDAGRVADLELSLESASLVPGPRAVLDATVRLFDRDGRLLPDEEFVVDVSEGGIAPIGMAPDGAQRFAFRPGPGLKSRDVVISARSETLDLEAQKVLRLETPSVNRVVSFAAGPMTNFGSLNSPFFAFDTEVRAFGRRGARYAGPGLMFRTGVSHYVGVGELQTGLGTLAELRMNILPVHLSLLLRQDLELHAVWAGVGAALAPYWSEARFDGVPLQRSAGLLPPGVAATVGYGYRVPGGELFVELRGNPLTSQASGAVFTGQVGGLATLVGFRLVY